MTVAEFIDQLMQYPMDARVEFEPDQGEFRRLVRDGKYVVVEFTENTKPKEQDHGSR